MRVTDGQTDGQNYDSQDRASIAASRGKKLTLTQANLPLNKKMPKPHKT